MVYNYRFVFHLKLPKQSKGVGGCIDVIHKNRLHVTLECHSLYILHL